MPVNTGFLNSNLIRAFPFVVNPLDKIPDWLIADFRAEIIGGEWDPEVYRVYLAWVAKYGERLRFGFRTDAPELADEELVFERDLTDPNYTTTFVESTPLLNTIYERCGCTEQELCNPNFEVPETCQNVICNPGFSADCGPDHICNPNFMPTP